MARSVTQDISGWGNFTVESCQLFRPEKLGDVRHILADGGQPTYVARGLGRSYGDSATNAGAGVILGERLDRLLAFDPLTGELECEAGVSLAEIINGFLPRGFFLPVTPGTKFVTVGGAIAADVHGKNHHVEGTLSKFVRGLTLLDGTGRIIRCSHDEDPDAFWATVGGMGLTGVILTARIQLLRVSSAYVGVDYRRAANLDHALELFGDEDQAVRYSVAWIDCLAKGASLGRSVLMRGDHLPAADLPDHLKANPLTLARRPRTKSIPFNFPGWALNRLAVRTFNKLFYAKHKDERKVVDYDAFFYPLDGILHWNRMYGKRGFVQYQALFPTDRSRQGLRELLELLSSSGIGSFLAVLKSTGAAGKGFLSYPFEGHTLALDLPNRGARLSELLAQLDAAVLKHGGRLYLAKDSCMSAETFAATYPLLGRFKEVKNRLDPNHRFASTQARRLGIVEVA